MAVVDRLVTVFEAQDKFSGVASKVKKSADETSTAAENSSQKTGEWSTAAAVLNTRLGVTVARVGSLQSVLAPATAAMGAMAFVVGSALSNAFGLATGFIAGMHTEVATLMQMGMATWFIDQTRPAWEAAMAMESYRTSFQALLGDVEKGNQMMKFVQNYGMKSAFEQGPIRDVVRTLIAAGLDVNRFLPMVETLALFRGPEGYNMTDMAGIIRRLVGGQIADAMGPEGLGRFGINKAMMIQVGAEFDNEGRFKGSVQDALDMLMRLTQSNPALKHLRTAFEDAYLVRWSNAMDAVNRGLETAGMVILAKFVPGLEAGADVIKWMVESGMIEQVVGQLADFFGGEDIGDGVVRAIMTVGAFFQVLPGILVGIGNTVQDFINNTIAGINNILGAMNNIIGTLKLPMALIPLLAPVSFAMMGQETGAQMNALIEANMMSYRAWKNDNKGKGIGTAPNVPFQDLDHVFSSGMGGGIASDIGAIRSNTGRTAKAFEDYMQRIVGGGNLAADGITAHSLSTRGSMRKRGGQSKAAVVANMIMEIMEERAAEMLEEQLRRNRVGAR